MKFVNLRSYSLQEFYIKQACEKHSGEYIDWSEYFIHCDNQNNLVNLLSPFFKKKLGSSRWAKLINIFKSIKKIKTSLLNSEAVLVINNYIIDIEAIKSHLAKRLRTSNECEIVKKTFSIFILAYDQFTFQELLSCNLKLDSPVVIFNGRVSPEGLIRRLGYRNIFYVEKGYMEDVYFSNIPPVTKLRWDNEFSQQFGKNFAQKTYVKKKIKKIVFFTTSAYEYEFASKDFSSESNELRDQYEMLKQCVKVCNSKNIDLVVKFHPSTGRERFLLDYKKESFDLTFNESDKDAVVLIGEADLVIVTSSSLALDAAILNKPVANLSPAFYEEAGISYRAYSVAKLQLFISEPFVFHNANIRAKVIKNEFDKTSRYILNNPPVRNLNWVLKRLALGH